MNSKEFLEIMGSRRSVREFLPDEVPRKDIETIITAASWAPSGTNRQNWGFIVIGPGKARQRMRDAVKAAIDEVSEKIKVSDAKKAFVSYTANFLFFKDAPLVIAVIKKPYESVTRKILKRYYPSRRSKASTDVQGVSAAVENLLLAAHALGYGACWMTGPLIAKDELEKLLGINQPEELMALIPLGKPRKAAGCGPGRKKFTEIASFLQY